VLPKVGLYGAWVAEPVVWAASPVLPKRVCRGLGRGACGWAAPCCLKRVCRGLGRRACGVGRPRAA
jgi:hypothetical protein